VVADGAPHWWKPLFAMLAALWACDGAAPRTVIGGRGTFADGQAFAWGDLDSNQQVREFGVTMPIRSFAKLSDGFVLTLALPAEVQSTTPFGAAMIEFKQRPILPTVYQVPRLDVRFFSVSPAVLPGIDCASEPMPSPAALPSPYVVQSAAAAPQGSCVPGIGVHAWDSSAPELAPDRHLAFQSALLLGYHAGSVAFIDPIQPLDQAEQAKAFDLMVPRTPIGLPDRAKSPRCEQRKERGGRISGICNRRATQRCEADRRFRDRR
jgi:hypothetical protein